MLQNKSNPFYVCICVCTQTSIYSYIKSKMECQYTSISVISQLLPISSLHLHILCTFFQPFLIWNFWKALQTISFLRFLPFRGSVSKTEAMVTILTEQLSLQLLLFGFVHAPEIPSGTFIVCVMLWISLIWYSNRDSSNLKKKPKLIPQIHAKNSHAEFSDSPAQRNSPCSSSFTRFPPFLLPFAPAASPCPRRRNNQPRTLVCASWPNTPAGPCVIRD